MIFVLDQYCLLEQDEVVGFLQHQVGHRIVFGDGSQAVDGVADDDQEEDHEDVCVEDGEYLDGWGSQVVVDAHVVDAKEEDGEEEEVDQTMQMFPPEKFPQKGFRLSLDIFIWCFFAENSHNDNKHHKHGGDEVEGT